MIWCLMVSGLSISPSLRNTLYLLALEMARCGTRRQAFEADDYEGEVSTDYQESWIGTICGTTFSAHVDTDEGLMRTRFLVNLDVAKKEKCDEEVGEAGNSSVWARVGPRAIPKRLLN